MEREEEKGEWEEKPEEGREKRAERWKHNEEMRDGREGRGGKGEETETEESDALHFHSFSCLTPYVSSTLVHATPSGPSPAMNNLWSDVVWFVIPHFLHKAEESRGVLGHSVVRPAQEVEVPHRKGFVISAPSPHLTVLQKHKCKLIQLSDQMVLTYFNTAHTTSTGGVSYSLGQT